MLFFRCRFGTEAFFFGVNPALPLRSPGEREGEGGVLLCSNCVPVVRAVCSSWGFWRGREGGWPPPNTKLVEPRATD